MPPKVLSEEEEQTVIRLYKDDTVKVTSIPEIVGCSYSTVYATLERHDVKRRRPDFEKTSSQGGSLDHDAFSELDDETEYWIGFLMADGAIIERARGNPVVQLALAWKDEDHVRKFLRFMKSDHSVYKVENTGEENYLAQTSFRSEQVVRDLETYGVVPNKTYDAEAKPGVQESAHFWRGVFDGDGSYSRKHRAIYICGSKPLMNQFSEHLSKQVGVDLTVRPHRGIYRVTAYGNNMEEVRSHLEGEPCLERKW